MIEVIIAAAKNLTDLQIMDQLEKAIWIYRKDETQEARKRVEMYAVMILVKIISVGKTTDATIREFNSSVILKEVFNKE